jgi:predicted transcriptional regulator
MTTLDRLYKKHLLQRTKEGRGFLYTPRHKGRTTEDPDTAFSTPPQAISRIPLISYLLDAVGTYDEALLQELEKTIAARRQQFERMEKR